jgi:peptidase M23-like protein
MLTPSTSRPITQVNQATKRSIALGKLNVLLALLGAVVLAGAYRLTLLPEVLALLMLTVPLVLVVARVWHGRRAHVEYGLVRHPFRRELRPYLLQCLNHWLFAALFAATLLAGTFAAVPAQIGWLLSLPLPDRIPYPPLLVALGVGALVVAALAVLPRRPVQLATNVLVAVGTLLLAIQLVRISTPPAEPVALHPPLAGEWQVVAGGRSVLVSHHHLLPRVADAVDFVRIVDGRGYVGEPKRPESWYGFGEPVLAPADGTVVSVSDPHPDEPIAQTGVTPPHGNHIVLELSQDRYAVFAHLKRGSARVSVGERVRLGQQIAAVGDSGNSLWPHLHFHVQDDPDLDDLDDQARTVPIAFLEVALIRNGSESTPLNADLRRGDRIRPLPN